MKYIGNFALENDIQYIIVDAIPGTYHFYKKLGFEGGDEFDFSQMVKQLF